MSIDLEAIRETHRKCTLSLCGCFDDVVTIIEEVERLRHTIEKLISRIFVLALDGDDLRSHNLNDHLAEYPEVQEARDILGRK